MKKKLFFASAMALALIAGFGAAGAAEAADTAATLASPVTAFPVTAFPVTAFPVTFTRLGMASTSFECGAGNPGDCHYLLLNSLCQERFLPDGVKERTCRYSEAVPPFVLKPGERKTVSGLPSDFLFTMKVGVVPTPSEVVNAPNPH